jgi:hypothetical protein
LDDPDELLRTRAKDTPEPAAVEPDQRIGAEAWARAS